MANNIVNAEDAIAAFLRDPANAQRILDLARRGQQPDQILIDTCNGLWRSVEAASTDILAILATLQALGWPEPPSAGSPNIGTSLLVAACVVLSPTSNRNLLSTLYL